MCNSSLQSQDSDKVLSSSISLTAAAADDDDDGSRIAPFNLCEAPARSSHLIF